MNFVWAHVHFAASTIFSRHCLELLIVRRGIASNRKLSLLIAPTSCRLTMLYCSHGDGCVSKNNSTRISVTDTIICIINITKTERIETSMNPPKPSHFSNNQTRTFFLSQSKNCKMFGNLYWIQLFFQFAPLNYNCLAFYLAILFINFSRLFEPAFRELCTHAVFGCWNFFKSIDQDRFSGLHFSSRNVVYNLEMIIIGQQI